MIQLYFKGQWSNSCQEVPDGTMITVQSKTHDAIYSELKKQFTHYVETGNYQEILRVYNQKGMLPQSQLCKICGISNKENYLNMILSILKEDKEDAQTIRTAIKECLGA